MIYFKIGYFIVIFYIQILFLYNFKDNICILIISYTNLKHNFLNSDVAPPLNLKLQI